jgi:putative ABC transport system substrate-binding protein
MAASSISCNCKYRGVLSKAWTMRRRDFISIIAASTATRLFAVPARTEQVRKIGVLIGMDAGDPVGQSEVRALKQGLQELGWIEGRNLHIEYSWAGGEPDRIQASAKELVGLNCEVIVARSTPAVAALLKETRVTPIVFTYVFDPIGSGFVRNFARPGGNVTGFQNYEPTIVGKWLQMLLEVAPSARRIGYIYNPRTLPPGFLRAFETFAPSVPVRLVATPVREAAKIDATLAEFAREPEGGLIIVADFYRCQS